MRQQSFDIKRGESIIELIYIVELDNDFIIVIYVKKWPKGQKINFPSKNVLF